MIAKTTIFVLGLLLAALLAGCSASKPAVAREFAFWPPAPDEPRLQYLCSFQSSASVEPTKSKLEELVYGKETQQIQGIVKPYGVDVWNGRIYVCDLRSNTVTILDLRKQRTMIIGQGSTDKFQNPSDITVAPDGMKYVADLGRGMIFVYDANDRHVANFSLPELKPVGVAVYEDELFVCDFKGQCVQVLDRRTGDYRRTIGAPGQGPGQFVRPLGIDVDDQGYIYVTDVLNCRLQKFDRQGTLVTGFGMISANAGGFVRPKHMAVDKDGTIYVVDAAFQNVQLFDQVGRVYTFFGSAGGHPGAMYLPAGIAVHDGDLDLFQKYVHPAFEMQRLIFVTNQFGENKVAVYALGQLKSGMTVKDIEPSRLQIEPGVGEPKTAGVGAALPDALTTGTEDPRDVAGQSPTTTPAAPEAQPRK